MWEQIVPLFSFFVFYLVYGICLIVSLYFFICKICGMLVDKVSLSFWCGYDAVIEPRTSC